MSSEQNTLLVRADAGVRMGTGHVMRCLGLAQAWQDSGGSAIFAMARAGSGVVERLQAENIGVRMLAVEPGSDSDACETIEAAEAADAEWTVLDGYHFGEPYQRMLKRARQRLLALDDFGKLPHYWADIVLNQDPNAEVKLYGSRESYTRLLLGTEYAFLRREFRAHPRSRRDAPPVARKLLITMGGSDPDNVTEKLIRSLEFVALDSLEAVVLVGPSNPHDARLEAAALAGRANVRLFRNPTCIPELMANCDLAITAGGSTVWELAYFAVPCLVLLTAENQEAAMGLLDRRGACLRLGLGVRLSVEELANAISTLCRDAVARSSLAAALASTIDGRGAERVCAAIRGQASSRLASTLPGENARRQA